MSFEQLAWLLDGESVTWPSSGRAAQPPGTDEEIDRKYARGEIRIVIEQARYSLKQVPDLVRSADYNLQPDFQRRPRWGAAKQSRLIESFIMNVPVPPVFLYESEFSRYEVMDGRQRLTAIAEFYNDKFALEGLAEWPELNGRRYSELPEQIRRGIDRRYLSSIVLLHETAKSTEEANRLKQLVFERINTGGEDLSSQEKRNALYPGPLNTLCSRLSRYPSFCQMWEIPLPDAGEAAYLDAEAKAESDWLPPDNLAQNSLYRTMEDVELALRFFAHRQRTSLWRGGIGMEAYLTRFLASGNTLDTYILASMADVFRGTCDLVFEVLGESAFKLYRERNSKLESKSWIWIDRPTVVAYDPVMLSFSRLLASAEVLRLRAQDIRDGLEGFYQANPAVFDGRKVNPKDVALRDATFFNYLNSFVDSGL